VDQKQRVAFCYIFPRCDKAFGTARALDLGSVNVMARLLFLCFALGLVTAALAEATNDVQQRSAFSFNANNFSRPNSKYDLALDDADSKNKVGDKKQLQEPKRDRSQRIAPGDLPPADGARDALSPK